MIWLIANWRLVLAGIALASAFSGGWYANGVRWEGKVAAAERKAEAARQELAEKGAQLAREYADKEAEIETRTRIIYRDIQHSGPDLLCTDDERLRFGRKWNEIARPSGSAHDRMPEAGHGAGEAEREGRANGTH